MKRREFGDPFVFMAVAETSSFTRAAVALGTSQPVVSQAIGRLEKRFGRLFERGPRGVNGMTDAGGWLADTVFPALIQIRAAMEHAESGTPGLTVPGSSRGGGDAAGNGG